MERKEGKGSGGGDKEQEKDESAAKMGSKKGKESVVLWHSVSCRDGAPHALQKGTL